MKSISYFIFVVVTTWLGSEIFIHEKSKIFEKNIIEFQPSEINISNMNNCNLILDTIKNNNLHTEKNLEAAKKTLKKLKYECSINY